MKRATFSSEVLRRLKTTHTNLEKEKVEDILLTFSDELNAMGYSEEWVRDTLKSAMVGYMRILHRDLEGEGPRNRKGRDTLKSRRFKRLVGISEWSRVDKGEPDAWEVMDPWVNKSKVGFKRKKQDQCYVESLVMIPHIPNSKLRHLITRIENGMKT